MRVSRIRIESEETHLVVHCIDFDGGVDSLRGFAGISASSLNYIESGA